MPSEGVKGRMKGGCHGGELGNTQAKRRAPSERLPDYATSDRWSDRLAMSEEMMEDGNRCYAPRILGILIGLGGCLR